MAPSLDPLLFSYDWVGMEEVLPFFFQIENYCNFLNEKKIGYIFL